MSLMSFSTRLVQSLHVTELWR